MPVPLSTPSHTSLTPPSVGVKLLKEFQSEYAKYEQQRQELTNAEKLFDLPITLYPDLIEVDRELRNMAKVYELYEAQRVGITVESFTIMICT